MIKSWLLILSLVAGTTAVATAPASAQTTTTYGYQCFNTLDGAQHCSCANFADSGPGYDWLFQRLAALQTGDGSAVMASHSDTMSQTQAANCEN